jgi:hypothetical protein
MSHPAAEKQFIKPIHIFGNSAAKLR